MGVTHPCHRHGCRSHALCHSGCGGGCPGYGSGPLCHWQLGTWVWPALLTFAGRVRLLGAAMAWPWLLPWASELSCRCGTVTVATGQILRQLTLALAGLLTAFYVWGEMQLIIFTPPKPASGSQQSMMAGCLPETLLGGQFRLDKADLEETGRAVFVPAQARKALYAGAGLALMGHLAFGIAFGHQDLPPWLLLGALLALLGRWVGESASDETQARREHFRLPDALAPVKLHDWHVAWVSCCGSIAAVLELQRCEAASSWLLRCEWQWCSQYRVWKTMAWWWHRNARAKM